MKIILLVVGATSTPYIREGIEEYVSRIRRFVPFQIEVIADVKTTKKMLPDVQKVNEGEQLLSHLKGGDYVVLLDERGKEMTSREFSQYLEQRIVTAQRNVVFVIGGPYGFSQKVYDRADARMSLSRLTFPHELVRLFFVEQLYRALTISRNMPYHHD